MTVDDADARRRVTHKGGGKSRVKQSERETDANKLVSRWVQRGETPWSDGKVPTYGDFTGVTNFHESLIQIQKAEDEFMALPSEVRAKCANDPGVFLEILYGDSDEDRKALFDAGLVPEALPEPVRAVLVDAPKEAGPEPGPPKEGA